MSTEETTVETDVAELPERLDLWSKDVAADRREELLRLFPEAATEDGQVDFDQLKRSVGGQVDAGKERYGMNWPGKAECFQVIQTPSTGTLIPCPEESVDFVGTANLLVEGDNLEVLKLLQKSYLGKVKMIYIDPPYNTGRDFIYPDNYAESMQTYLEYTGQVDAEGRKFSTNTDSEGRFHSKWLNMMYPRVYLARNLLRDDGVVFISIDDGEVDNLRKLCNEVFGEENFIATVIWQKVFSPKNSARHMSDDHDYVVVYGRNADSWRPTLLPRSDEANARYENPDGDPRGPWTSGDLAARNYYGEGSYSVTAPGGKIYKNPTGTYWRVSFAKFRELDKDQRIWWGQGQNNMPRLKRFLSEVKQGVVPQTLWTYSEVGHTQEAKKELLEFVNFEHNENVLDTVKPTRLIRRMLQIATRPDTADLVVDFFAGSGATGHAVLAQNVEDGGNRRFLLVQLPEPLPTPESSLKTIADMTKERIRRVGEKLSGSHASKLDLEQGSALDVGFRVFKLAESNFTGWDAQGAAGPEDLKEQLELHVDHIRQGRSVDDLLCEILLKSGFPLTTEIQTLQLAGKKVFSVADGALMLCLDRELTLDLIRQVAEKAPERVVFLDDGFAGNDQLKANAVQIFKTKGVTSFKTV